MSATLDQIDRGLFARIASHVRACYPAEACGLLVSDAKGGLRFCAIENVAGTAAAGGTSDRSARDGYVMHPGQLLSVLEEADRDGGGLACIVHSHPDVGAYFSAEDRRAALGGGDGPLWPGVSYLVVSCRAGTVDAARLYTWEEAHKDFREESLPID